jgi:hypothetical protein
MPNPDQADLTIEGFAPTLGTVLYPGAAELQVSGPVLDITAPQDRLLSPATANINVAALAPRTFEFFETSLITNRITLTLTLRGEVKITRA